MTERQSLNTQNEVALHYRRKLETNLKQKFDQNNELQKVKRSDCGPEQVPK